MPLLPIAPPQAVPIHSGFDYVTVDARRRRVYAAHTGSQALLIVDADSGKVVGQVDVGPLHGVAVNPTNGHIFTGNGEARTVAEIDPVAKQVVRSVDVAGNVDALAYDPRNGHIYADEDDGTHIFVIDAKTMKSVGSVLLPGHKPEFLAVDPQTHDVYQNIANLSEFVVVDGTTLKVKRTVATPELKSNHPLQYNPATHHILVGGKNGMLAVYDSTTGKKLGEIKMQPDVDQCSLDVATNDIACAGNATVTVFKDGAGGKLSLVTRRAVSDDVHTVGIDPKTHTAWIVWARADGDFVQGLRIEPELNASPQ